MPPCWAVQAYLSTTCRSASRHRVSNSSEPSRGMFSDVRRVPSSRAGSRSSFSMSMTVLSSVQLYEGLAERLQLLLLGLEVPLLKAGKVNASAPRRLRKPLPKDLHRLDRKVSVDALHLLRLVVPPRAHVLVRERRHAAHELGTEGGIRAEPAGVVVLHEEHREGRVDDRPWLHVLRQLDDFVGRLALILVHGLGLSREALGVAHQQAPSLL